LLVIENNQGMVTSKVFLVTDDRELVINITYGSKVEE
jgi:hypothetical protein